MIFDKNNVDIENNLVLLGCGCSGSGSGGCIKGGIFDSALNSKVFSAKQLGVNSASCVS